MGEKRLLCFVLLFFFVPVVIWAEQIKLPATGDVWLSGFNKDERNKSWGRSGRLKLKSIQEMAILRFDPEGIRGRDILTARLFLRPVNPNHRLRYIRISTVNQNWEEGDAYRNSGATYNHASRKDEKLWAWPGSQFCDVSFSSGNSLSSWAELRREKNGWISVNVAPELIIALAVRDTDGLALMDGGTYKPFNNFIYSRESETFAPYLLVESGQGIRVVPGVPVVHGEPDPGHAGFDSGAVQIAIKKDPAVFCWKVRVNNRLLERWQIPHPTEEEFTRFYITGIAPGKELDINVTAVSRSGHSSASANLRIFSSGSLASGLRLGPIEPPLAGQETRLRETNVWGLPGLVKISPLNAQPLHRDMVDGPGFREENCVWDGKEVSLFGIRGEYIDFQLCLESPGKRLEKIRIIPGPLEGPDGSMIRLEDIEVFRNWYAKTREGVWQPAYTLPADPLENVSIPGLGQRIKQQTNQTFTIDIYIPKEAVPGVYQGQIRICATGIPETSVPLRVRVYPVDMPDRLAFWPEMNAYHIPKNVHDYYRLAHQNRCVANFWAFKPEVKGLGKNIKLDWEAYDEKVGSLLDGSAFNKNRRKGVPVECLYLPYKDSWPTRLSRDNYRYTGYWPQKGDSINYLIDHYMTSPYIGEGLTQDYKARFLSVQRQYIQHFKEKGWNKTELQFFMGGKKKHRIDFGSNMWWTTDEPYHWGDWLALQFFNRLWTKGRKDNETSKNNWQARADISRPQWQGRVIEGDVDTVYYGEFNNERTYRRCRILKEETGIQVRAYGSVNDHEKSNMKTVGLILNAWLNGADGFQIWWSTGRDNSLDVQEGTLGNALLVPGKRFGTSVVGDMRLKALRKGQQMIEYLVLLSQKYDLNRRQLRQMVYEVLGIGQKKRGDCILSHPLKAWQITGLRREILQSL